MFNTSASPSEPRYFMYTFPDYVEKVNVRITSDSDVCAKIYARKANCPAFDASGLVELSDSSYYQSFTTFGGFSLRKSDIGPKFHLAFTVEPDDVVCETYTNLTENPYRVKNVNISVIPIFDETVQPIVPVVLYISVSFAVIVMTYFQCKWLNRNENNEPNSQQEIDSENSLVVDKIILFDKPANIVSYNKYHKNKLINESKYFNFLLFQFITTIILSVPVLQQLKSIFPNENTLTKNVNLDNCYLNYLCSSSVFGFNCFNGMISSNSMVVVGVVNLFIVFRKKIFKYKSPKPTTAHGVQKQDAAKVVTLLGMFAMGLFWTLISNCPHKSSLHFYTYTHSWTFISAFMWLHAKRHGTHVWQHFFIIALSSVYGCLSFLEYAYEMTSNYVAFLFKNILFVFVCVSSTVFIAFNYVYESKKVFAVGLILLSVGWSVFSFYPDDISVTKCIFCLEQCQVGFYLVYYVVQKIRFERSTFNRKFVLTLVLIILTSIPVIIFYLIIINYESPWYLLWTPAKSRTLNRECITPGIDWADMDYYMTSAIFILFIIFMDFIDSNVKHIPKKHIFVF
ncbi:hypothetical protein GCK72_023364 [Caenorhabditis remanei]|uniref:Uncharacterized protein n=1 Tax=Caenorhabditis remanei TaxID=31234 RepID=A0A6A5FWC8_CAERE|nr:hypothetical protein GCK72_023364 [Caenorhabditis remanei]KAF1746906.1 hypothetical protein GCK72_023364 [Caenorhabditis remanei]